VDRLELRMRDGHGDERGHGRVGGEDHEVVDQAWHVGVVRRDV
jgi:hypothetical protein